MQINLEELRKREGYITCRQHPTLPLLIWNYTAKCQYDKVWDDYTRMCRGLITDLGGNIVARPFAKFFNVGEMEESRLENLPPEEPMLYEKLDGSLGIQYYDGDKVCIATRGSFTSEQAIWATKWIQDRGYKRTDFKEGYTYIYEIIY